MEKLFCIKSFNLTTSLNQLRMDDAEVEEGKWYLGEEISIRNIKRYRIFGEGKSHLSEIIIPNAVISNFLVGDEYYNLYDDYKGIFDKELFITKSKYRDNRLNELLG